MLVAEVKCVCSLLERQVTSRPVEVGQMPNHHDRVAVVVTVSDKGPGVPEEAHVQMFEPFQRIGDAGVKGFGLGLTIRMSLST